MRKHSAQQCPICQLPWQTCYDSSYVHKPHAQSKADNSYSSNWNGQQSWDYAQWDGGHTPRGKSPRSRQRPRSAKKTRENDYWQDYPAHGGGGYPNMTVKGQGKGGPMQSMQPPQPPAAPWNTQMMMGHPAPMPPPVMQSMPPMASPPQMMTMGMHHQKGGPMSMTMPASAPMMGTSATPPCLSMQSQTMMAMPPAPPCPPEPDAQFWEKLRQRKTDLPPDIQQEITKREGVRVSTDLLAAVQQMSDAREEYEKALHGRSQHLQAWKTYLEKAVSDWQAFAQQFIQHEQHLQERIAYTKEVFMKAKEDVDSARKEAGEVVDLTEEDEPFAGNTSGTSAVVRVTASIQELTSSLQKLHSDAAALEAEAPPVAKRPRVEVKEDSDMNVSSKPAALEPFGKAGQQ
eukprot:s505_g2.t1